MFRRIRERRDRARAAERRATLEAEASGLDARAGTVGRLADLLADPAALWNEAGPECPIVAKRGEEVLFLFEGVSLLELRTQKRTYRGTSHGLSIRVAETQRGLLPAGHALRQHHRVDRSLETTGRRRRHGGHQPEGRLRG